MIENDLRECLLTAQAYNYLGEEERALQLLDSLQLCIHKEYSKKLPKEQIIRLSELYSRSCIEAGRIFREKGDFDRAVKNFHYAVCSYFGEDNLAYELIVTSDVEIAETYKLKAEIGDKEAEELSKKYENRVRKILEKINQ